MHNPGNTLKDYMNSWLARVTSGWFMAVALATPAAAAVDLFGTVIHVDDGDTITLLLQDKTSHKIRLSSIDAPESSHTNKSVGRIGQPFSSNSKRYLASLVKGIEATARCFEQDRYGRSVCEVFVGSVSANQAMVRSGYAWANTDNGGRYLRDKTLPGLQAQARADGMGLWADSNPIPPWVWRRECWGRGQCNPSR